MKKKTKTILASVAGVLAVIITVSVLFINAKIKKLNEYMDTVEIHEVDLQSIADGVYDAETNLLPIIVKLSVEVKDHKITSIDLIKHISGKGGPAGRIVDDVVEKQSLLVDTISGATYSSKVILKTIEKALE